MSYPKRLIEVDLPIKRISAHARREKSIRHGHISTLHIWWARRPLAACRAVILASLWPDPADPDCPLQFLNAARKAMQEWTTHERQMLLSAESRRRFDGARKNPALFDDLVELRGALLDFIADFSNWDNSTDTAYLATSRALTQAAHEALGGAPGTRPLVLDPFAGGGSIPLEALRVGADAFASDLNPIPVLLNKVVLEYIPKYGQRLADEVRNCGAQVMQEAERELAEFYPKDPDGATPIAYLWARTIQCEGPGCGAEVPLIRSLWLSKRAGGLVALKIVAHSADRRIDFQIIDGTKSLLVGQGTIARGSASCPCCGFTTRVESVRTQLKSRQGGSNDARLLAVVVTRPGRVGRFYRLPTEADLDAVASARTELENRQRIHVGPVSLVPDEFISLNELRRIAVPIYGMERWGDLFSDRQALALTTLVRLVIRAGNHLSEEDSSEFSLAVQSILAIAVSRLSDICNALCMWETTKTQVRHLFTRQAIPMLWDFAEPNLFADAAGNFNVTLNTMLEAIERQSVVDTPGHVAQCSSASHVLPDDSVQALITDPPYYDAVPYAYLSDFFYVWLRRTLGHAMPKLFDTETVPKDDEIVVDRSHYLSQSTKDIKFYERELGRAFGEARRTAMPSGVGVIVFASKTTASWEAVLQAVIDAGWTVTGSWPIDTELENRVAAQGQARLASSVHIVVRPRENPDGSLRTSDIGDWRDVLAELPRRIHEWMPRLADEGVVGADAIFACLGPALEIFSRYARVEKASGDVVTLREYLEHVWSAVAKEALAQVFKDADTAGFEPDARLTAMWLWTLNAGNADGDESSNESEDSAEDDDEGKGKSAKSKAGFILEYDAARKIAQGLGANLDDLPALVQVSSDTARLLPVSERTGYLFGKDQEDAPAEARRKKAVAPQLDLFAELVKVGAGETAWQEKTVHKVGETTLDRVHQSMILFATGRGEALKRFLVDDGAGKDQRFWKLAQALSALYPSATNEKRWVDGVLARKKGLGL